MSFWSFLLSTAGAVGAGLVGVDELGVGEGEDGVGSCVEQPERARATISRMAAIACFVDMVLPWRDSL